MSDSDNEDIKKFNQWNPLKSDFQDTKDINKFQRWNPLKSDYEDLNFNRYCDEFDPGANKNVEYKNPYYKHLPYLCIKNVPRELTKTAVLNLFSTYGKVVDIRAPKPNLMFVDFKTIEDMESAYTNLQSNEFGLTVVIGSAKAKPFKVNQNLAATNWEVEEKENEKVEIMNLKERSIRQCFSEPKPPVFEVDTFINLDDWNSSKLDKVDPNKHFFIKTDIHYRDRMDLNKLPTEKFNFFTGRSYYLPDEKDKEKVQIAQKEIKKSGVLDYESLGVKRCAKCKALTNKFCADNSQYYCSSACVLATKNK